MRIFQVIQRVLKSQSGAQPRRDRLRNAAGFSLMELLVATALMVILGGMVFGLFDKHAKVYKLQQEVTELNLGLRSSLDLITADLLNAGANLSSGGAAGAFPFPVLVSNNVNGNFDQIIVYQGYATTDSNYLPPTTLSNVGSQTPSSSSTLYVDPAPNFTDAQTAARLPSGTFLVIANVNPNDLSNYGKIYPITLTQNASVTSGGGRITLTHTASPQTNDGLSLLLPAVLLAGKLGASFPVGTMVVKLAPPITYQVSTTNPARPELVRSTTTNLSTSTFRLASNVLGFSQRARLANGQVYDSPAGYPTANDCSLIRSLEVTITCRTESDRIDAYASAIDSTKSYRLSSLTTKISLRNKASY
jgi:hypothetical protein